ncbi:MAG: hypothetical protein Q9173_004445 [Seirophora scorigena]
MEQNTSSLEKDYVYIKDRPSKMSQPAAPEYRSHPPTLAISATEQWEKELMQDPKNRLALSALSANNASTILTQRSTVVGDTQNFNVKIALEGAPITNQKSSGRCWLFAATNVFRVAIMKRYNLKEFELSQAYLFYWDKLEKANYFLEQILDTVDEDLEGRLIQTLLAAPVGDGGQWDMVANLVEKYGLIPQLLYPDSFNAQNSSTLASLITTKLREDALELRQLASQSTDSNPTLIAMKERMMGAAKEKMMRDIHRILTLMLGLPPSPDKEFTWEYYDKDEKFHSLTTTPLKFASELSSKASVAANSGMNIHELFSLVNDPRNQYGQLLSVSRLGNVINMRPVRYVNVDMTTMKKACISMLRADIPIFFGSDVGKFSDRQTGIMDTNLVDYELGFNVRLGLSKAQRLMTHESAMTHAMVLTAVHVVEEKPVRWRVQNSWGDGAGTKGWFVMSDGWMDEFVYQAVVDPRLDLWDPMGALAQGGGGAWKDSEDKKREARRSSIINYLPVSLLEQYSFLDDPCVPHLLAVVASSSSSSGPVKEIPEVVLVGLTDCWNINGLFSVSRLATGLRSNLLRTILYSNPDPLTNLSSSGVVPKCRIDGCPAHQVLPHAGNKWRPTGLRTFTPCRAFNSTSTVAGL